MKYNKSVTTSRDWTRRFRYKQFCNSVGEIYHRLHDTHAMFIAPFNNDGYNYQHSDSNVHGLIVGLCIDNVNHPEMTSDRVKKWCDVIKEEIV